MPLTAAQKQVAVSTKRWRVLISGRRFGKTTLGIREICKHASEPGTVCWAVCPSYRQAKNIWWLKLKKKLFALHWIKKINEAELTIYLKNGSLIALKGAENYDSLRGNRVDFLVMDEVADIKPEAFYESLRPTLSDSLGEGLFMGTPKGLNWAYDLFNNTQTDDEWASWQFTTEEGGNVPPEELESARRLLDERTYKQEYQGSFESFSGRIYYAFEREKNVEKCVEYDLENGHYPEILHIGEDFNIDPSVSVVAYERADGVLHVIDEIGIFSSNTDEMVAEIKTRYPKSKIFVYPDPAGRQRKTSANGMTDIIILQNAGFVVKAPNSHPPVRDRINAVNSRMLSSTGEVRLVVEPRCKRIIEGLERQVYKEGSQQPDKDSGYDHWNDALGYMVHFRYPLKRDTKQSTVTTWKHRTGA
jgi:hypothetical protein